MMTIFFKKVVTVTVENTQQNEVTDTNGVID